MEKSDSKLTTSVPDFSVVKYSALWSTLPTQFALYVEQLLVWYVLMVELRRF